MSNPLPPPPQLLGISSSEYEDATSVVEAQKPEPTLSWMSKLDLVKNTVAAGLTHEEFALFVEICRSRRLNPLAKQVHAVKRQGKLVIQTAIDGYRLIAERTGKYLGQTPPFWCGNDGTWRDVWTPKQNPFAAKVGVHKAGQIEPTWGIAYWDTYVAPGPFWNKAGAHMLSKCAEALALKKAFPEELSGLYTDDEMSQADSTIVTTYAPPLVAAENQPIPIFPTKVVKAWTGSENIIRAIVKDANGDDWLFNGSQIDPVDKAMSEGSFVMVFYHIDTNVRVVDSLQVDGGY